MIEIRKTVLFAQCLNDSHDLHLPALVPSLTLGSVGILPRRLGVFVVAAVNRNFWPNSMYSGLGPFPENSSNPALKQT